MNVPSFANAFYRNNQTVVSGCGIILFDVETKEMLLGEEYRLKNKLMYKWSDFGGKCEPFDRSEWATAVREFEEETCNAMPVEKIWRQRYVHDAAADEERVKG